MSARSTAACARTSLHRRAARSWMSGLPARPMPSNRALWRLARRLGGEIGLELTEAAAGGASDGNTTSLYTATLDGLGPVGDGAHAHHEHLDIDLTIERTALLTLLLLAPPVTED